MYRTNKQFNEITTNCLNGNWSDAAKLCVEGGFWVNDLIRMNESATDEALTFFNEEEDCEEMVFPFEELTDIAIVSELAMKIRNK